MSLPKHGKMKAVTWEDKAESVSVKEVDIPRIQDPLDAIVRITSAAICGTDLHTFHGRIPMRKGETFGHENMGIIEKVGSNITTLKKGDRVLISDFDGQNDSHDDIELAGTFGLGDYKLHGPRLDGGQAQYMRVPNANVNTLVLPEGNEHELDYLLLADIWPTAWYALDCAGQVFGDTVVVFGAGPVGLLCAYSAKLRGAIRVYSVDHVPERLARAKSVGAIPINFAQGDPVAQILKQEPNGVDRACDCVGFECINAEGENVENIVITQAINVTRAGGGIGLIGVYTLKDNEASTKAAATGILPVPIALFWTKGQSLKGGILPPEQYKETQNLLKLLIERDNAKPSFVFDREFRIEDAPEAFREFSNHNITKAVFRFEELVNADGKRVHKNGGVVQDPLQGEPIRKRMRRS